MHTVNTDRAKTSARQRRLDYMEGGIAVPDDFDTMAAGDIARAFEGVLPVNSARAAEHMTLRTADALVAQYPGPILRM